MSPVFLCFLYFSQFFFFFILSSSLPLSSTKLSLSPIDPPTPPTNSWDYISHIAKHTLHRAHHLKNPHKKPSPFLHSTENTPLLARSYGGYSVSLSFGTPTQTIPLVFDTGSSLLWVPCTSHYTCINCTFSGTNPAKIPTFIPKHSSTTQIIGCRNPKCGLLFGPSFHDRCPDCSNHKNCSEPCSIYGLQYGLGTTSGFLISENLDLPGEVVAGFTLGCSVISSRQPEGIAGFGRSPTSLPSQLKLKKFSYCLLDHKFDDKPKSSDLILTGGRKKTSTSEVCGLRYTRFHKNPNMSPYDEYYYVDMRAITVGKKRIKLPTKFLIPGPNGEGGVIVDSGSTFSFMDRVLFDPLVEELASQINHMKRDRHLETQAGFGLCYDASGKAGNISLPELAFHFKGGGRMSLPLANYFSLINDSGSMCLTIVSDSSPAGPSSPIGPVMIMGNYQHQNFYIEYDLEKGRFGFKKQKCGKKKVRM